MVETAETVRARRRETRRAITRKAHELARLTETRRELVTVLRECEGQVERAKEDLMALLDEAEATVAPVLVLCAECSLIIPEGTGVPGRKGLYHQRCMSALVARLILPPTRQDADGAPEQECAS
jgi:hypothetical protein